VGSIDTITIWIRSELV